jgi:DNA-binding NtrC family response regulator
VLLIDPDECFRNGLAENLRDDGHDVCECAGPSNVPAPPTLGRISAAVVDYSTGQSERLALADALHQVNPTAAIILITPCWPDGTEIAPTPRPFLHMQSRPLDYAVLHDLIHRLCAERSQ